MNLGMSIGVSGLNAAMTELDATSENIANATTPGYSSEVAQLATLAGGPTSSTGDGVEVTSVAQVTSALLSASNLQAQGALSNISSTQQVLSSIQNIFPLGQSTASTSTTTSSNTSLAGELSDFWNGWDAIAQAPSTLAPRTSIIDQAQGMATTLNEASSQLSQLSTNTSQDIATDVTQVNSLLTQAANINASIAKGASAGQTNNQLSDQMSSVINQLGALTGVTVTSQSNGTSLINIGGVNVVQGAQAATLAVTTTGSTTVSGSDEIGIVAYPPGASASTPGVAVPVSSGSIAGLLTGVNSSIPQYQNQFNGVAQALATTVNSQLEAGYNTAGSGGNLTNPATGDYYQGAPLFVPAGYVAQTDANGNPTGLPTVTASSISVNSTLVANPMELAASSVATDSANDGTNAQNLAELGTVSTGPDLAYQNLIENIGADTQTANSQLTSQTAVATQAQSALQSVTGVNQDAQLTALMSFQNDYQASAKVVSTIDATIQSLLAAV